MLSDGSLAEFGTVRAEHGTSPAPSDSSRHSQLTAAARRIRTQNAQAIEQKFPRTWRNSAGYRINYLVPWSAGKPAGWSDAGYLLDLSGAEFNVAQLLAGSEGTLGVIQDVTVRLVARPRHAVLGMLAFEDLPAACEAVPELLEHGPAAVELIPRADSRGRAPHPGLCQQDALAARGPGGVVGGRVQRRRPRTARSASADLGLQGADCLDPEEQAMVWATRKAGLGLLDTVGGPGRPTSFIEDCAVPVEHLAIFVRELERIMDAYGARGGIYGHASAGCLHARPVLDLKTGEGVRALRQIAEQTLELTLRLGGAMSSEHGDGITRGEWLRRTYGDELVEAMRSLKRVADPEGILNPGKMLDAPPMDTHLRYGTTYKARGMEPGLGFP